MYDCICTLPLTSEAFAHAIHPTEPLFAIGTSSGHVHTYELPSLTSDSEEIAAQDSEQSHGSSTSPADFGKGTVDTTWKTRRHKGSCRTLGYSTDGEVLYSGGTDRIVKAASSRTGKVFSKIAIQLGSSEVGPDTPSLLHAISPQTLLLATDSAALHLYDIREAGALSSKPQQTFQPHDDYISSLTPIPPTDASTSGFAKQWVTTGDTTLAVTDLRKGVLERSEDQEEELLSSAFVEGGFPARKGRSGQKVAVGGANGVVTLWEKGVWDDQESRIVVDREGGGESVDALMVLPGVGARTLAAGLGDGRIKLVKLGPNSMVGELRHDEIEGVTGIDIDIEGRLISSGGQIIKVWREHEGGQNGAFQEGNDSDSDGDLEDDISNDPEGQDSDSSAEPPSKKIKLPGKDGSHAVGVSFNDLD